MRLCIRHLALKLSRGELKVDNLVLRVKGGAAGVALPKYGGIGGDGGDVILKAQAKLGLSSLQRGNPALTYVADAGIGSNRVKIVGDKGKPLVIPVPMGVQVTDENDRLLGELNVQSENLLVANGAKAGNYDTDFKPEKATFKFIRLQLKLIADFVFVGFPNAGKSTLLRSLSNATPRVSPLPFTTQHPHMGIVEYPDFRRITVADMPGLIEGAYRNVGLGHQFLKHMERSKALLFVLDISGFQLNSMSLYRNALDTLLLLNKELELYDRSLLKKPAILCINKMDLVGAEEAADKLIHTLQTPEKWCEIVESQDILPEERLHFKRILKICAKQGETVEELKEIMRTILDQVTPLPEIPCHKPIRLNNLI